MANSTDPFAQSVHGTNPQYLIEKITRLKIYNCMYWKEHCFGLTAETIVDKVVALKYIGGTYGGNNKPTDFLCLVLKLLQLQPEKEIILEFVMNEDFKYLRAIGAFYLRLVGKPEDIYTYLEPLLNDYRKLSYRGMSGWQLMHMDELVDQLLSEELVCDVALPHLPKRLKLEELDVLQPRKSVLGDDLTEIIRLHEEETDQRRAAEEAERAAETDSEDGEMPTVETTAVASKKIDDEASDGTEERTSNRRNTGERERSEDDGRENRKEGSKRSRGRRDRSDSYSASRRHDSRSKRNGERGDRRKRDYSEDDDDREYRSRRRSRERSKRYSSSPDSRRPRDSRSRDRHRDHIADRRRDDSRDRKRPRRDYSSSRDRHRSSRRSGRDRSKDRDSHRRRSYSDDSRDRRGRRDDTRVREDYRDNRTADKEKVKPKFEDDDDEAFFNSEAVKAEEAAKAAEASKKATKNVKKFDKIFGKKKPSGGAGKEILNAKGEKVAITAPEGSIEYWNQIRESLGMSKLKQ